MSAPDAVRACECESPVPTLASVAHPEWRKAIYLVICYLCFRPLNEGERAKMLLPSIAASPARLSDPPLAPTTTNPDER